MCLRCNKRVLHSKVFLIDISQLLPKSRIGLDRLNRAVFFGRCFCSHLRYTMVMPGHRRTTFGTHHTRLAGKLCRSVNTEGTIHRNFFALLQPAFYDEALAQRRPQGHFTHQEANPLIRQRLDIHQRTLTGPHHSSFWHHHRPRLSGKFRLNRSRNKHLGFQLQPGVDKLHPGFGHPCLGINHRIEPGDSPFKRLARQ